MVGALENALRGLFPRETRFWDDPAVIAAIVVAGVPAIMAATAYLGRAIAYWRRSARQSRTVLMWIEIEARTTRQQLATFDAACLQSKTMEIRDHASRQIKYRFLAAMSQEPNEYKRWRTQIERYSRSLIEATAQYIEYDAILDAILKRLASDDYERLSPERQIGAISLFVSFCETQKRNCDVLIAEIEAQK
jgi:hypothetical protein